MDNATDLKAERDRDLSHLEFLRLEAEHANSRIAAYFEIQIKIVGLSLTAVMTTLGWLVSGKSGLSATSVEFAMVLLAITGVSSIAMFLGTLYNSFALGYIHYKAAVLGPKVKQILRLRENPLSALASTDQSPARLPIMFSTGLLGATQAFLGLGCFLYAVLILIDNHVVIFRPAGLFTSGVLLILVGSAIGQILFVKALKQIRASSER